MKKLHEYLGIDNKPGLIGLEIECEGRGLKIPPERYWKTDHDGSLRGKFPHECAEYVLNGPATLDFTVKALDELIDTQRDAKFDFSFRTSVHVHINMLDCNLDQLLNTIYTYLLLETTLLRYCGDVRIGNRFCLRLVDAEEAMRYIKFLMTGFQNLHGLRGDHIRYAAINLAALGKYGSLEFRGMRGTIDKEVLLNWINTLLAIREYAVKKKDVRQIHEEFLENGSEFLTKVLGKLGKIYINDNTRHDIAECYSVSYELPITYKKQKEKEEALKIKAKENKIKIDNVKVNFNPQAGRAGVWPERAIFVPGAFRGAGRPDRVRPMVFDDLHRDEEE